MVLEVNLIQYKVIYWNISALLVAVNTADINVCRIKTVSMSSILRSVYVMRLFFVGILRVFNCMHFKGPH